MLWKILIVLAISMIPLVELRGAIPIAVGMDLGLPEWAILITAIIGNIIPVPIIFFFARKVLDWGCTVKWKPFRQFCEFCLRKGEKGGKKLLKRAGESGAYFALFLFVAIPIPGTGAWTGTLAASILGLDFKKTMLATISGILVAGFFMLGASLGLFRLIFGG